MNTNVKRNALINKLRTQIAERMGNGRIGRTCGATGGGGGYGHGHNGNCSGLF